MCSGVVDGWAVVVSAVRGDAAALVVELDGRRGVSRLDQFVNELVGHAVEVAFDLDMVINVDATGRPMRQDVAGGGQGAAVPGGRAAHSACVG